jgi:hypothetical protein
LIRAQFQEQPQGTSIMATAVANITGPEKLSKKNHERLFFWGMSVAVAVVFFIGFAKTYFLARYFHARPLAAPIVHVHAAAFTSWIVLLVTQTSLAASGNVRIHRRLGLIGLALAPLMVVLGALVAHEMIGRMSAILGFERAILIYAVALSEIAGFALPVFFAFWWRRWPAYHKRLILIGTVAMTTAGFGRWPIHALLHQPLPAMGCMIGLLALVAAYDLRSLGKIHPATALGSAWVIGIELMSVPVSSTAAWHAFAAWSR